MGRAPKIDTIKEFCDSNLAVEMLLERGDITQLEADGINARIHERREAPSRPFWDYPPPAKR